MTPFFEQDNKRLYEFWTRNIFDFHLERRELELAGAIILEAKRLRGFYKLRYWRPLAL